MNTTYTVTQIEPAAGSVAPDPATQKMVESVLSNLAPTAQTAIANVHAQWTDTSAVATLAAKAAIQRFQADAAIVDVSTVWNPLPAGPVSAQNFYDSFKVEREPPGTPGFSSFYTVQIDGGSLQTLSSTSLDGWVVVAPATMNPTRTYVLAGQKRTVNHPSIYLPSGVTITGTPVEGSEVWDALTSYAKTRQSACLYVDVDQAIPGCMP